MNKVLDDRIKIRPEVHSRQSFAYERGLFWFNKIKNIERSGNVLTSKATIKFLQARRIFNHYRNEFQNCQQLPLSA